MASNETHYVLDRPSFDKPVKVLIVCSPYFKQIFYLSEEHSREEFTSVYRVHILSKQICEIME